MEKEAQNQPELRRDGKLPVIYVEANDLAVATYKSIIACHDFGARVETPKYKEGQSFGYDADMIIRVNNPADPLQVYIPGIHDDARGLVQYVLEVTHGIHNHWKKSTKHPDRWGYTYNERFADQLPFVFDRIEKDFKKKGKITSRQYQFSIWRAGEDIIPEQPDPPCLQRGHLRFLIDSDGNHVLNYITDWRSRDLLKAWNENNVAQLRLMKLFAQKVSGIIGQEVKLGAYIDRSSSLHLYGYYVDRDGLEKQISRMKNTPYPKLSCSLDEYFMNTAGKTEDYLKRLLWLKWMLKKKDMDLIFQRMD
jgi:thymidylate synthase